MSARQSSNPFSRFSQSMILGIAITLIAGGSQAASRSGSVTTVIKDAGVAADGVTSVPLLVHSDSPLSGGSQTYGGGQLASDLLFSTQPGRKIFMDLQNSAGGTGAPFATAYLPGNIYTYCGNNGLPTPASLKGIGTATQCPMAIRVEFSGSTAYFLRMNPYKHATDNARITCTGVAGDPADPNASCNAWKIEPIGADGRNLALLTKMVTVRLTSTETELGNYYTSFFIALSKP